MNPLFMAEPPPAFKLDRAFIFITFPEAWDKATLSKLFSRMTISFGEPVAISSDLPEHILEAFCR